MKVDQWSLLCGIAIGSIAILSSRYIRKRYKRRKKNSEGNVSTLNSNANVNTNNISTQQNSSTEIQRTKTEDAKAAIFMKSSWPSFLGDPQKVKGYDFNQMPIDYDSLLQSYKYIGFQASNIGRAIDEINKMLSWRLSDESIAEDENEDLLDMKARSKVKCKIYLGYTSNLISSGLRDIIRFLVQHNMVDVIVTTGGGIEEDFIKCLAPTYLADFELPGKDLRQNGINRIGNLVVPNNNYCLFQDWVIPIFDKMAQEQSQGFKWTPSKVISRLGKEINNPESVYYWAYKNNIPVFCPAITDGSLGDMLYFHSFQETGLAIDIVEDIRAMNDTAVFARHTGIIILGGGLVKHHICNANLTRNGADHAVFVNTAQEFDGSDAGARPDEAVSWGKIKSTAKPVKIYADATIVFPLLVAQTFAKHYKLG